MRKWIVMALVVGILAVGSLVYAQQCEDGSCNEGFLRRVIKAPLKAEAAVVEKAASGRRVGFLRRFVQNRRSKRVDRRDSRQERRQGRQGKRSSFHMGIGGGEGFDVDIEPVAVKTCPNCGSQLPYEVASF